MLPHHALLPLGLTVIFGAVACAGVDGDPGLDGNGDRLAGETLARDPVAATEGTWVTASPRTYYVSTTGSDTTGNGCYCAPWRTLKYASLHVAYGDTISIAAGTYVEAGPIEIPVGVNVTGAGRTQTILKAVSSFYYHPSSPGYALDKYLIRLKSGALVDGNQVLSAFKIDGDGRQLHGGIFVNERNKVTLRNLEVTSVNFNGIWIWSGKDETVQDVRLINTSWGSTGWESGALQLGDVERVVIDSAYIDEDRGYGIKAIGPSGANKLYSVAVRNSRISVTPQGTWNGGSAPNIAIEYYQADMKACEISSSYIDNTISLISAQATIGTPVSGVQTVRIHDNTLDFTARAGGLAYAVELTTPDVEIDHNYVAGGRYGIANWGAAVSRWQIHHNVFYNLQGVYPGDIVRAQSSGLHDVLFSNNTIEFNSDKTMQVIGLHGGSSDSVHVVDNVAIDLSPGTYSYYPTVFLFREGGAVISNLTVENNLLWNLPMGSVPGTYLNNILNVNPQFVASGARPDPYYRPGAGSPLIDAGIYVGYPYLGAAPNIGAYE